MGRAVVVITCLVTAGLGVWFAVASWDSANKVAVIASALAAVAAVGVAVWAGLRTGGRIVVSDTGDATAGPGGRANTGVRGATSARVKRTGNARAGGDANTGVE
ncbi:hypothetical protein [Umezawaea sp. NPDC059074]|uniref:hypothetical protein n=1 Tax=Umezawaea sp. NPDC059074 TaxID=3346716 RepID=UPI0036A80432